MERFNSRPVPHKKDPVSTTLQRGNLDPFAPSLNSIRSLKTYLHPHVIDKYIRFAFTFLFLAWNGCAYGYDELVEVCVNITTLFSNDLAIYQSRACVHGYNFFLNKHIYVRLTYAPKSRYLFLPDPEGEILLPIGLLPMWYSSSRVALRNFMRRIVPERDGPLLKTWHYLFQFLVVVNGGIVYANPQTRRRLFELYKTTKLTTRRVRRNQLIVRPGRNRYEDLILDSPLLVQASLRYKYRKAAYCPNRRKYLRALNTLEFLLQKHKEEENQYAEFTSGENDNQINRHTEPPDDLDQPEYITYTRLLEDQVLSYRGYLPTLYEMHPARAVMQRLPSFHMAGPPPAVPMYDKITFKFSIMFVRVSLWICTTIAKTFFPRYYVPSLHNPKFLNVAFRINAIILNFFDFLRLPFRRGIYVRHKPIRMVEGRLVQYPEQVAILDPLNNHYEPEIVLSHYRWKAPKLGMSYYFSSLWMKIIILISLHGFNQPVYLTRKYVSKWKLVYNFFNRFKHTEPAVFTSWNAMNSLSNVFTKNMRKLGFKISVMNIALALSRFSVWYYAAKTKRGVYAVITDMLLTSTDLLGLDADDWKDSTKWLYRTIGYVANVLNHSWAPEPEEPDSPAMAEAIEHMSYEEVGHHTSGEGNGEDNPMLNFTRSLLEKVTILPYRESRAFTAQFFAVKSATGIFGWFTELLPKIFDAFRHNIAPTKEDLFQNQLHEWADKVTVLLASDSIHRDAQHARDVVKEFDEMLELNKALLMYNRPGQRPTVAVPHVYSQVCVQLSKLKKEADLTLHSIDDHVKAYCNWFVSPNAGIGKSRLSKILARAVIMYMTGKVDDTKIYPFNGRDHRPDGISPHVRVLDFDDFGQTTDEESLLAQSDNLRLCIGYESFRPNMSALEHKGRTVIDAWLVTVSSNHTLDFWTSGSFTSVFSFLSATAFLRRVDAFVEVNWYEGAKDKWNAPCPGYINEETLSKLSVRITHYHAGKLEQYTTSWNNYIAFVVTEIERRQLEQGVNKQETITYLEKVLAEFTNDETDVVPDEEPIVVLLQEDVVPFNGWVSLDEDGPVRFTYDPQVKYDYDLRKPQLLEAVLLSGKPIVCIHEHAPIGQLWQPYDSPHKICAVRYVREQPEIPKIPVFDLRDYEQYCDVFKYYATSRDHIDFERFLRNGGRQMIDQEPEYRIELVSYGKSAEKRNRKKKERKGGSRVGIPKEIETVEPPLILPVVNKKRDRKPLDMKMLGVARVHRQNVKDYYAQIGDLPHYSEDAEGFYLWEHAREIYKNDEDVKNFEEVLLYAQQISSPSFLTRVKNGVYSGMSYVEEYRARAMAYGRNVYGELNREEEEEEKTFLERTWAKVMNVKVSITDKLYTWKMIEELPFVDIVTTIAHSTFVAFIAVGTTVTAGLSVYLGVFYMVPTFFINASLWWCILPVTNREKENVMKRKRWLIAILLLFLLGCFIYFLAYETGRKMERDFDDNIAILRETNPKLADALQEAHESEIAQHTSKSRDKRITNKNRIREAATFTNDINATEQVISMNHRSVWRFYYGNRNATMTHVCDGVFVGVAHSIVDLQPNDTVEWRRGGSSYAYTWKEFEYRILTRGTFKTDVVFVKTPRYCQLTGKDTRKSWIREKELLNLRPTPTGGFMGHFGTIIHGRKGDHSSPLMNVRLQENMDLEVFDKERIVYKYPRLWEAVGDPPKGSSGGVWLIHNPQVVHKLIGVQTARMRGKAYGVPVTYEDVCAAVKFFDVNDGRAEHTCGYVGETLLVQDELNLRPQHLKELGELEEEMIFVGFVKPKFAVYTPSKSDFYPSPIQTDAEIQRKFPAEVVTTEYGPANLGYDAAKYRNKKLQRRFVSGPDPEVLEKVCLPLISRWPKASPMLSSRIPLARAKQADFDHNLQGPHMSTGLGVPLRNTPHVGKTPHMQRNDNNDIDLSFELIELVLQFENSMEAGRVPTEIVPDVKKDEILDPASLKKGKTRRFVPCSLQYWLHFQMYFGAWMDAIRNSVPFRSNMVGINVHGADWNMVFKNMIYRFRELGMIAGDVSVWDVTLLPVVIYVMGRLINRWYILNYGKSLRVEKDNRKRSLLIAAINPSYRILGLLMVAFPWGITSGLPATAEFNGVCNEIYHYSLFHHIATTRLEVKDIWKTWTMYVRPIFYGDDSLLAVESAEVGWYNQIYLEKHFDSLFGMTYTDARKTGKFEKFTPFDEITFLKRNFRERDGIWFAPMQIVNIRQRTLWLRRTAGDTGGALRQNIDSALRDFFQHGREVFEREKEMYNEILYTLGLARVSLEYDELLADYSATY